jgi:hypothetical protein
VISHLDATAFALRVTHCGNAACTAGNLSKTVDDPSSRVGDDTSITIGTDGLPVISHNESIPSPGSLRVTRCGTATC